MGLRQFPGMLLTPLWWRSGLIGLVGWSGLAATTDGDPALSYIDESDPFYVGVNFPKLTTPQWVGEDGVEAVVIIAIDDMREPQRFEDYLRPIIDRLKSVDGRAPVSIMSNTLDPTHPQLATWLAEGLTFENHTLSHPCPLLKDGDLLTALDTYHGGVDLMASIPGNDPVAYRMPCCDSLNTTSPRFLNEIFGRPSPGGHVLSIDSSVVQVFSSRDPELPRELVTDPDGSERFWKYLPFPSFATTIENYPYPFVIGGTGWEFPCTVPSDWEAQNLQEPNNPKTVDDWKAAIDATVLKQGVFTMVIHTWGWIENFQMVELIDYVEATYGNRVKFLNFREALERLNRNLLRDVPLRGKRGEDNGVRLIDLNQDGYLDVVSGGLGETFTRVWQPESETWRELDLPARLIESDPDGERRLAGLHFGRPTVDGNVVMMLNSESRRGAWIFGDAGWAEAPEFMHGLRIESEPVFARVAGRDQGMRWRDVTGDGRDELLVSNPELNRIWQWSGADQSWQPLEFALPPGVALVDERGRDNGLRFVDLNVDGFDDIVFSNPEHYSAHLYVEKDFLRFQQGWSRELLSGVPGDDGAIPLIVRDGPFRDNGAWFHSDHMWVQNEDTANMMDLVDRLSFQELMVGYQTPAQEPDEALASFDVRDGFGIELVASEPQVLDPVAFEWGEDGVLWVVEMRDYPLGIDGEGAPGGVIKRLTDEDGDGLYETAVTFLDGLSYPTGVMPWRDGVLISVAPEIRFARDTDGDGRADETKVLFRGFVEGNQQHLLNGFEYGLDNWIYGANGDSGGIVHSPATGEDVDIRGDDFRFRPDELIFEGVEGRTQFGRRRDDWGNWFGNNNPAWGWHYFLPNRYLARNPYVPVRTTKRALGQYANSTRVYYTSTMQQRFNDPHMIDHVTSANSPSPYRDDWFGDDYGTSVFISESVYNVVHREVLSPDGISFSSRRGEGEEAREFLASTDNWFRPTTLKTGPDGALYIADMYRFVIEHPEWIPEDTQKNLDLRLGEDRGRIYRVFPLDAERRPMENLAGLDGRELAARMDSSNGWVRDTVQRIVVANADRAAVPELRRLATTAARPRVRLQALATLDGLSALTIEELVVGLTDADSRVRREAVRMAETELRQAGDLIDRSVAAALAALVGDDDEAVRMQLAFTLGEWPGATAAGLLSQMAANDWGNEPLRVALQSSLPRHHEALTGRTDVPPELAEANRAYGEQFATSEDTPAMVVVREIAPKQPRPDYAEIVAPFAGVETLVADPERGHQQFKLLCVQCHRFRGAGQVVGPDLDTLGDSSVAFLLQAILDPHAALEDKFAEVVLTKRDGKGLTGVLVDENETSVTLRIMGGAEEVLLKADIARMDIRPRSLMPEGLGDAYSPQDMADLLGYLRQKP